MDVRGDIALGADQWCPRSAGAEASVFLSQQVRVQDMSLLLERLRSLNRLPKFPYNPRACPPPESLLLGVWLVAFLPSPILLSTQSWRQDWPLSARDCIPTVQAMSCFPVSHRGLPCSPHRRRKQQKSTTIYPPSIVN